MQFLVYIEKISSVLTITEVIIKCDNFTSINLEATSFLTQLYFFFANKGLKNKDILSILTVLLALIKS